MIPCLAQVSTLAAALEDDLEGYAAGACRAVELWLGKLERWLEGHSVGELRELLARHGLTAPVASFQGGLLAREGEARREHWSGFERRLALCKALGVEVLVVAGDVPAPLAQADIDRVQSSLRQAAQLAGRQGVRLALEFQGRAALGNNLASAAALVAHAESPWLGLCLDAFHFYVGPSKHEDLAQLSADNLFHVQLCDLAGQPRELAADGDRILPGDGDFHLAPIVDRLRAIGYARWVSIELMNPLVWQVPPRQFGEIAMTALRRVLG